MNTETQNSKEKRMRELCAKLKGFVLTTDDRDHFKDYSLTLERLEILLQSMLSEFKKTQKENTKELRNKTATLKELRAEVEAVRKEKDHDHLLMESSIIVLKTHCSESKKKLQSFKDSCVHSNVENLKEQNARLSRDLEKHTYTIQKLNFEKTLMIPITEFKTLEKKTSERESALQKMGNWERRYWSLKTQCDHFELDIVHLKAQLKKQNSVQESLYWNIDINNQINPKLCQARDDERLSNRSQETCESMEDQFQIRLEDSQRARKKRRGNRKGRKGHTPPSSPTIQQDPNELTDAEISGIPYIEPKTQTGQVRSFGLVMLCMFILTGLLDMSW